MMELILCWTIRLKKQKIGWENTLLAISELMQKNTYCGFWLH